MNKFKILKIKIFKLLEILKVHRIILGFKKKIGKIMNQKFKVYKMQ